MKSSVRYLIVFCIPLLMVPAFAQSSSQDAHAHGLATLTLALENEMLQIQFESPAANVVGFEYAATSPEERQSVVKAEATLAEPAVLFFFEGTDCQSTKTTVDVSGVIDDESKENDEHADHHHHDPSHHSESGHSEISAEYHFSCEDPQNLVAVSVALISQFPSIERIDTMWITVDKQGAASLTTNRNTISLD